MTIKKITKKASAKKNKRNIDLQHKKEIFLKALSINGIITEAAKAAKIPRQSHYDWMKNDPEYPARYEAAYNEAVDSLEQEAISRARDGWEEPVYQGGKYVGSIRKKSDTLLIFLLKGAKPEKYRERYEHSGEVAQTVKIIKFTEDDKK